MEVSKLSFTKKTQEDMKKDITEEKQPLHFPKVIEITPSETPIKIEITKGDMIIKVELVEVEQATDLITTIMKGEQL